MFIFDDSVLKPGEMSFDLVGASIESGRSMSGITGAIDYSAGGLWVVEYKKIFIETRTQHKYWSYLRNKLTGGVENIVVPIDQHGSAPVASSTEFYTSKFSDSTTFADGTYHSSGAALGFSGTGWSKGESTVTFTVSAGDSIIGGETFSVFHSSYGWRCYSITDVDYKIGSTYTVGIRPPLRDDLSSGCVMEFLKPKCTMRLMPGSKIPMEAKPPWHNPNASISFVESFNV